MSAISISKFPPPDYVPPLPFFFPRSLCSRGAGAGAPKSANSVRACSARALVCLQVELQMFDGLREVALFAEQGSQEKMGRDGRLMGVVDSGLRVFVSNPKGEMAFLIGKDALEDLAVFPERHTHEFGEWAGPCLDTTGYGDGEILQSDVCWSRARILTSPCNGTPEKKER